MSKKSWAITSLGIISVIGALGAYKVLEISSAMAMVAAFPEHSETVEKTGVTLTPHINSIQVLGTVKAPQQIALQSELGGTVTAVNFASGQWVNKGQVIIQLDVHQELAQLAAAKASAKVAKSNLARTQTLHQTQSISQSTVDEAYAQLLIQQSNIAVYESTINKKTIHAPFNGHLGLHEVREGQYLAMNQVVSTLVASDQQTWVDFTVPNTYPALALKSKINISYQGKNIEGEVIAQHGSISNTTQGLAYRANIQSDENWLPNSKVQVSVPVSKTTSVVVLPSNSVLRDGYGEYVYQLIAQQEPGAYGPAFRAQRISVKVVDHQGATTLVTGDLNTQQIIATQGAFKLFPNVLVYAKDPTPTPTQAQTQTEIAQGE